jgi:dTDP-4-amino-4,6-dideoxygalactose transaminase
MSLTSEAVLPFNRATRAPRQVEYLAASFFSDRISGDGPFSHRCVEALGGHLDSERVLLTPSCTSALEMSALLSGVGPGDEVIVPSFTFVSSANAFLLFGATPVFADIDPFRFNVTPESIADAITARTKAVVVVHYGGISCDMTRIRRLCDEHGLILIEDCAHALFASSCGRPLGTHGDLATFSFHETKNVTCGEGGALLVNRDEWWDRALIVREKGTDRTRFMLGQVDKYTWVDRGSSYLLADPLAAIVLAQLEFVDVIQARRKEAWLRYATELPSWATRVGAQLPTEVTRHDVSPYHLFPVLLADNASRDAFLEHCRSYGVTSVFHYLPLHESRIGRQLAPDAQCPVTVDVSGRLARLPLFSDITRAEVDRVIDVVTKFPGLS